jgi:nicotinamidase-related amidase
MSFLFYLIAVLIAFQCVLGTLIDAYFAGYDSILITDATATTSPEGCFFSVSYNTQAVRVFPQ